MLYADASRHRYSGEGFSVGRKDFHMRLGTLTALAAAAAVVLAAWPADAQTRKRTRSNFESYQDYKAKRANARIAGRPSARITVRRARSFLDPGTEVEEMSRSYTDYAIPPTGGGIGLSVVSGPVTPAGWQNPKWPLPGRFEYGVSRYLDPW
jgi:hypothetical protein